MRDSHRLIRGRTPAQLKMVDALRSRQAVVNLLRDRFGIELAVRTIGLYLERWGVTPQKPSKKAYQQSLATVDNWLQQECRWNIIGCALKSDILIDFMRRTIHHAG